MKNLAENCALRRFTVKEVKRKKRIANAWAFHHVHHGDRPPVLCLYCPKTLRERFLKAFWPHFEAIYGKGFLLNLTFSPDETSTGLEGRGVAKLPNGWLIKMLRFRTEFLKSFVSDEISK
jgi:hypothetical protein